MTRAVPHLPLLDVLVKLFLAAAPLMLTVLFAWLTMEGHLNFGSGEKDIFVAVPLLIWSIAYLCSYLVLWWRRFGIRRSVLVSSGLATGVMAVAWVALFGVTWFRFR